MRFRRHRAYLFILALLALVVLILLGTASLRVSTHSLFTARRNADLAVARGAAEAATDWADAVLRRSIYPPTVTIALPQKPSGRGTMRATIAPSAGNASDPLKYYTIRATGTCSDVTSEVLAQFRQQSFAMYAYFTDQERSSVTNGTIWFFERDRLRGPVHSNDRFHVSWSKTAASPIFYSTVSSASTSVDWGGVTPKTTQEWRRIFEAGQPALTLGADTIALPAMTDEQAIAAWGGTPPTTLAKDAYTNTFGSVVSAGVYVQGDCTIEFRDATDTQIIEIVHQAVVGGSTVSKTTLITVDLRYATTTVATRVPSISADWSTTTHQGLPNGVIYCNGHITSLRGTVADNVVFGSAILRRNAWTVVAQIDTAGVSKDIKITDRLQYRTPPDPSKPPTDSSNLRAPVLGLVAQNVRLTRTCPNDMRLDGVVLAGGNDTSGSFYYEGWSDTTRNTLRLTGGVIQSKRGPVGTFNTSNGALQSGYAKDYWYDPRLKDTPPPCFPTTGKYDLVSWQYH